MQTTAGSPGDVGEPKERRRYSRFPTRKPARCRSGIEASAAWAGTGELRDLGAGGLRVLLPIPLSQGTTVECVVPGPAGPIQLRGTVAWARAAGSAAAGGSWHGLTFGDPDMSERALGLFLPAARGNR